MYLDALPKGSQAVIEKVDYRTAEDPIAMRLDELGFIAGEAVQIIATGFMGGDPIAVRVGSSRFALRRSEAARVSLRAVFPS